MKKGKRKRHALLEKVMSGLMSALMIITTVLTCITPITAKAEGSNYTLISLGEEKWYDDVFSGYDDSMGHWKTYHFTVQDDYGNEYEAICIEPHKDTPRESETFTATTEYGTDDIEARAMFWAVGAGWNDEDWGVLKDYPYELRWIIAHHTIALANGQDDWNTPLNGNGTFLGDGEGKLGWELCQELLNIASNISPSSVGYECSLTYLSNDSRTNQSLGIYNDTPVKEFTGSVRFHKESAMPSISEGNSCYSLAGAEISVYSDSGCTDLLDTLTTGEDGYTGYYSTTFREGESVTLYFKETKAPKGFLINDEVRSITLDSEDSYTETITDMPGNDPISLVLSKRTADGHGSGNTRLEGAEYTVKYYDALSDTDPAQSGSTAKYTWVFKTDEKGRIQLTPDYLLSGSDGLITNFTYSYTLPIGTITIQETKSPEGYLLNDTVYVAKTDIVNGTVRTTNLPTDDKAAQETPYEGTISIQKFLGGSNAVKASEPDAEFQIYLKSAGSYDASPEDSRQTITTDANGYAVTKRLPYGTYTIHQTKGNNKYYFINDIDVTISDNNANYHKILENTPIEFYLKMVKKDADTGNTVNVAGATFELYDENGSKVSFKTMTSAGVQTFDSFTTNENGCVYTLEKLLKGNYTLVETKAPEGYVLDSTPVSFTVSENTYTEDGGTEIVVVEKADKAVTGQLTVTKVGEVLDKWDAATADNDNHFVYKKANIQGASFTLTAKEDIKTADNNGYAYRAGDVVAEFTTGADGSSVIDNLPLGSYVLTETKAPAGFVIDTDPVDVTFTYAGQTVDIVKDSKTVEDERQKIAVDANKTDAATMNPLLNTVFALYADEDIVNHDGTVIIKKGAMIERQTTNALGKAVFVSDLPLGHYIVKEIDSPTGYGNRFESKTIDAAYKSQTTKVQTFSYFFEDDHTEIVRTQATDTATGTHQGALSADNKYVVYDHVECDNLFPGKTYTLKGALTDKDTGKTLKDINGNDVTDSVTFKATGVKQTVTVTFSFEAELAGKTLVAYENMFQDGKMIYTHADIDDTEQTVYYPEIHTTATDKASQTHTGTVDEQTTVIDKVDYKNLIPGSTYEVSGVLMNQETGAALLDKDGKEITAKTTFKAEKASGSVELAFTFDSTLLIGKSVVAFEELYNENIKVAFHTDIRDEGQTVHYPEIHTTATDAVTKTHTAAPDSKTTIIDKVDYKNLVQGESYEVSGIIMDKTTGEALTDKNGNTITSKTAFKAEKADGSIDVTFTFDSTLLEDKSVVVYEDLYSGNAKVTSHADITDEGQTVNFPKIQTTATDKNTFTHTGMIAEKTTITDKVDYSNLTIGEKYKLSGVLMNQETGKKLLDKNGKEITSEKEFTAESKNGSIDIEFTFDSSLLAGKTTVVFEDLYNENVRVAFHTDIKDEGQTVHYPEIHTTATDKASQTHTGTVDEQTTITDKVDYKNLVIGNTYEVRGVLMDKTTGKELLDREKKEITATKKFTAEKPDGTVELAFTFDSSLLTGKSVVVFEDLYNENIKVAFHTDIRDEGQTVHYPEIHTTATDAVTKTHTAAPDSKTTIIDKVDYKNLVQGESYEVSGIIMDKTTGEALTDKNGNTITSKTAFKAEKADGSIDVTFTFDSTLLEDKSVVVYEDLYSGNAKVTSHADITDEGQTVNFPKIQTTATDKNTFTHTGMIAEKTTITDKVDYSNLTIGEKYKLSGVLMNQETGKKLLDKNGKEITSEKEFTAESKNGSIDIEFTFDSSLLAGKTTVVFEDLYNENVRVAFHTDIKDEGQTVHYPEIHTTATDAATKTHTAAPDVKTTITDKVDYKNLVAGNSYEIKGVLMDKTTGKALLDKDKKEITATKKFTAKKPDGTVELAFTFDSSLLTGKSVVVFEDLYNENVRVAFHTDIKDEGQTVNFPEIHTTATDKTTGTHTGVVDEKTTITDKVDYSNLTVGEKYKVSGVLMNQETGEKLLDKDGNAITSEKEFTAKSRNGSIDIEFTFDSSLFAGKTTVVFEELFNEKIKVASHADIKDEGQSVHFPEIHTTATIDSAKSITEKGSVILKDVVDYKNLIAGKTYEVKGVLMNQETGEKFLDKDGNEITGSASFTAQKADGSVDVTFTFDSSLLAGNTIVVFENLYENNVKVIGHADINDVNQTVEIVKTGDTSNAYIYALIALISLAVMVSLVMIKKSRNHN
ncbi:MAG: VaFE repeat-containing surface-anchored protein [Lachnospira eligens]